jgi:hypothetical protein
MVPYFAVARAASPLLAASTASTVKPSFSKPFFTNLASRS